MTPTTAAYIEGWRDAGEMVCNTLAKVKEYPEITSRPIGRDIADLLDQIATVINDQINKITDTLSCTMDAPHSHN